MDFHKELFRVNNEVLSPRNHNVVNRKLHQANRAEKRKAFYNQGRNIPLSPQFKEFHSKAAASSTPMTKNGQPRKFVGTSKENYQRGINVTQKLAADPKSQETVQKNLAEKISRHEAHIRRFIEWKANKKNQNEQKEHEKQSARPPFIPVGKSSETSFAPKGHIFRPPACLKDPKIEAAKRNSIYIPVPTPPKKKEPSQQKSVKMHLASWENKNSANNIVQKRILAIKTFAALREAELGDVAKISGLTTAKKFATKINNLKHNSPKGPVAPKYRMDSSKQQNILKPTIKCDPKVNKYIFENNCHITNGVGILGDVVTTNQEGCAKSTLQNANKDHLQKTTMCSQKDPTLKFTTRTVPNIKSNRNVDSTKFIGSEVTKKVQSSGAIGKTKAMQLRKNPVPLPSKPKLAVNLKAKKTKVSQRTNTVTTIKKSSRDIVKQKNIESNSQITYTKSKCSNVLKASHLAATNQTKVSNENLKENFVSKPETLQKKCEGHDVAKRRKFNFLKQIEFDTTNVDSPVLSTTKEDLDVEIKSNKIDEKKARTPQNTKMVSKVLKKLQLEIHKKPNKLLPPIETTLTTRRSNKRESSPKRDVFRKTPKFNFLVNVELDATAVELEETIPGEDLNKEILKQHEFSIPHQGELKISSQRRKSKDFTSSSPGLLIGLSIENGSEFKERKRVSILEQRTPIKIISPVRPVETPIEKRRALEAVNCFRKQLQDEIHRLHTLCDQWDAYKEKEVELLQSNEGEDMINVATGQTRLLTSKKFMQFSGLIDRCEAHANGTAPFDDGSEDTKAITPVDLEGFWSMLGLQIENIQKRFENLERWKTNGWKDPDAHKPKPCNRKKAKKSKDTPATSNEGGKPRANVGLRQMMSKMRAQRQCKHEELSHGEKLDEVQVFINDIPKCSPRRLRRSMHRNEFSVEKRLSNTPGRINIVVPNRRSRSLARTVISVPSPVRASPQRVASPKTALQSNFSIVHVVAEKNELLKTAVLGRTRRSRSLQMKQILKTPSPPKIITKESPPRTPASNNFMHYGRKSILKTPGTGRSKMLNVIFNDHLSVKKFRPLKYGDNQHGTEYEAVQEVHIDDFMNMKAVTDLSFDENRVDSKDERAYHLRNRRVKLRPSCEIELPK